ncbi:AEC family transporter [Bifidobacterium aquikefiri]|uniref:Permease n=1 Tax=Bifidobacterium aquikefiri TaxID=1653207 RepID=A0A261G3R9_9BIFI|nr:AEC family transporter [Bifidobacterium aquikefiri]OZG66038.1 permease [Bifidobacterium aquikefiri]
MSGVIQALALLAVLLGGYGLKRARVFGSKDYKVMEGVVFDFTLPCAIIYSFSTNEHHLDMLWLSLFGIISSLIPLLVIYASSRHMQIRNRVFMMLNGCGMNVGNFCLPVITALLGQGASMSVIMFDIGNSLMMCAGMYVMTTSLLHIPQQGPVNLSNVGNIAKLPYRRLTDRHARWLRRRANIRNVLRSFYTSVPFDTYVVMVSLMVIGVRLPQWFASFFGPISNANGFCSMLMVGMLMDLPASVEDIKSVCSVIGWKLLFGILLGLAAWYLLPFEPMVRKAVVLVCLAPTAVFSTLFTDRVLGNAKLAGFTLASTGILSLMLITILNELISI